MSSPPLEPPMIASRSARVTPVSTRWRSQEAKSSNTCWLAVSLPLSCHPSPYSAPPRRFAIASTPPCSSHTSRVGSNHAFCEMPDPPYPVRMAAADPSRGVAGANTSNIGTRVPSADVASSRRTS